MEDIDTGFSEGKTQLDAKLTELGRAAGLTETDLARQLRASFYGSEVLRQQRGRDEVKVIVRLPRSERDQLASLENLVLRTPSGGEIPLSDAAVLTPGRAYSSIRRINGARVLNVTAEVVRSKGNSNAILGQLRSSVLPVMMQDTPGLSYSFEGSFVVDKTASHPFGRTFSSRSLSFTDCSQFRSAATHNLCSSCPLYRLASLAPSWVTSLWASI